ncbi:tetratricopeptide repeat protein [Burkholderia plantarii]|uniref:tetratricopeptide repeat protein n=1 Tax=Burkholderia plantarii TaxID=41899 RepID=UPI0008709E37|nr:tetratricopeptide repeat protein [Burkholderia plantarii]
MTQDIEHALAAAQQHAVAGRLSEATRLLHEVLASDPAQGDALEGLGHLAIRQGDHAGAADYLVRAAAHLPMSDAQLDFAAQVCQSVQRHADALALFERSLERLPNRPDALHGATMSLIALGEHARALDLLERLCRLQPRSAEAHYNRGTLLGTMARYDDELDAYRQAIALNPRFTDAYVNLGVALRDLTRFDEALQQFKKALAINPNDVGARTNRAQTNLLLGEYEHGWREYEWRWREGPTRHGFPAQSQWSGAEPLAGRTILVHHEQGFGDTLQFVRFVDRLAAAGARVVLRVQDPLLPLLRDYPGAAAVIGETAPVPAFDFHIPMLSLPLALKVREADIAVPGPYLHADAALAAGRDDLPAPAPGRPRVGLVWSGSRTHRNDRNRSMTLAQLAPLLEADAAFFSLQPDLREGDRAALEQYVARGVLHDVSARLGSFADTAALVARLDLVISVDTAVAHLAGALGKPVWIALPFMPDWRWRFGRDDSPWYAGARLFRQVRRGDWSDVVAALRTAVDGFGRA